jgi:hypothetical protein
VTLQDTATTACHSDHYIMDCESEASFESWIEEDDIDVLMFPISTSEKDYLDSLADEIRLDYFI